MIRVHLKPDLSSVACVRDHESSQTRAPNVLCALTNKAFKVIVSCLTVMDRTRLDWDHLFKNGLSAVIKLPGVITPFFILALVS